MYTSRMIEVPEFPASNEKREQPEIDTRRLAFEVYAVRAGQNIAETIRLLLEIGVSVPQSTVYYWRQHDGWDERIELENAGRQEELIRQHAGRLRVAAPEAIAYLQNVVSGSAQPDPQRVIAAKTLIQENRALIVAVIKEKAKSGGPASLPLVSTELDAMSDTELLAYQERIRSGEA